MELFLIIMAVEASFKSFYYDSYNYRSETIYADTGNIVLSSCDNRKSSSPVNAPGARKSSETQALETGADLLQRKTPLNRINVYLDGFHFYNGNMQAQMEDTKDGQVQPDLVKKRDDQLKLSTADNRKNRSDIPFLQSLPGPTPGNKAM